MKNFPPFPIAGTELVSLYPKPGDGKHTENFTEETTELMLGISIRPIRDDESSGSDCRAEPHDEEQREDEPEVRPHEHLPRLRIRRHVHVVVARQARPTDREAKDDPAKAEHRRRLGLPDRHRHVDEVLRGNTEEDEEGDGGGYPGPLFESVDELVPKQSDDERDHRDDHDPCSRRNLVVRHGLEHLCPSDRVDD